MGRRRRQRAVADLERHPDSWLPAGRCGNNRRLTAHVVGFPCYAGPQRGHGGKILPVTAADTFSFVNLTVIPAWLLLIFMPRWEWTRIVAAYAVPSALAIVYLTLLLMNKPPEGAGFGSIQQVERLFSSQWLLLAGWVHYLAFDLFIGAWEVRDAWRL